MRIFCSICKELFIPNSEIHSTVCGHIYHDSCIARWLKQHKTCPQCRTSVTSQPIRLYFDVDKDNEIDASTLEHQLGNVTSELRQSRVDNKILREKNEKMEKTLGEIEQCSTAIKRKNHLLKSSVQALKDQIITLTKAQSKFTSMKNDLEALKTKIRDYESLDHIINCTSEEANKLLQITPVTEFGLKQLSIYTSALKDKTEKDRKRLTELVNEKKELQKALAVEQSKNSNSSDGDYRKLKKAYNSLQLELSFTKDILRKLSEKVANSGGGSWMHDGSQVTKKRPLFTISTEVLENVNSKAKEGQGASDVTECIKHWEDMVVAGPSKPSSLQSSINPKDVHGKSQESLHSSYAFDGMGGSKKICLAHQTSQAEFNRIKDDFKAGEKKKRDLHQGKRSNINNNNEALKQKNFFGYLSFNDKK